MQNVRSQSEFIANEELLKTLEEKILDILDNKVLHLLQQHPRLHPSPRQIIQCLNRESELYRLINSFKFGGGIDDVYQLRILLKLDEFGLNAIQELVRSDKEFVAKLYVLLGNVDVPHEYVRACLADNLKMKCLRLITWSEQPIELVLQLKDLEESTVWKKLALLAEQPWQFPKDTFRHAVICRVLLNSPTLSESCLQKLLTQSLQAKEGRRPRPVVPSSLRPDVLPQAK